MPANAIHPVKPIITNPILCPIPCTIPNLRQRPLLPTSEVDMANHEPSRPPERQLLQLVAKFSGLFQLGALMHTIPKPNDPTGSHWINGQFFKASDFTHGFMKAARLVTVVAHGCPPDGPPGRKEAPGEKWRGCPRTAAARGPRWGSVFYAPILTING